MRLAFQPRTAKLVLLLWSLLPCAPVFAIDRDRRLDQLYHTSWTFKDGAPSEIFAIAQTTDGYLWLGTTSSLVRFDGVRFERFEPPPGQILSHRNVSSLLAVPSGGLWIGFADGGASLLQDGKISSYGERDGLPPKAVRSLVRDRRGAIWAATLGGLARFDGSRWIAMGTDSGFSGSATAAFFDHNGTLWVGTTDGLVFRPDGAKTFETSPARPGYVTKLVQTVDGGMWAATLSATRPLVSADKGKSSRGPKLTGSSIALLLDSQGSIWATSLGDGVRRLAYPERIGDLRPEQLDSAIEKFDQENGLSSGYVESAFEDREGNVWFGTKAGLDRFRQSTVVAIPFPSGYSYFELMPGDGGEIWANATDRGFSRIYNGKIIAQKNPPAFTRIPPPDHDLVAVCRGSHDVVWVARRGKLLRFANKRADEIDYPTKGMRVGEIPGEVVVMVEDDRGRLWISLKERGVFRLEQGRWTDIERLGGPHGFAISAFTDASGRVWFGYLDKTVVLMDGDRSRTLSSQDGVQVGKVRSIGGNASNLWIGGDNGLAVFDGKRFRQAIAADGNDFSDIFGIVATASDGLWLSESRGIVHIPEPEIRLFHQNAEHRVNYRIYDLLDGLPAHLQKSARAPRVIEASDGILWFATTQGLAWVNPRRISRNTLPPPVVIETLAANGRMYSLSPSLTLPARTATLQISYTAPSLTIPERVRFRYKLEGVDKTWQEAGPRREAFYTNPGPGAFRFRVLACNNDGVWTETGAVLNFVIAPAFYETVWFESLCGIAAAGVLWLLYLLRLAQVTGQIQLRLGERLIERERIARELHDTLLQGFQGLILHFESVLKQIPPHEPARDTMIKALDRADQVLLEGRNRVRDLRSEAMPGQELSELLATCGKDHAQNHAIEFTMAVEGMARPIDPIVRDEMYQIGREAIANAFRYSEASKIEVEIAFAHANLRLRVRDDGKGIEQETLDRGRPGHWGLSGMRERAQKLGAQLTLWSRPGAGTEIELTVPAKIAFGLKSRK